MLTKLKIKNFRCFEDHTVSFKSTAIVVGPNNAGKSTLIEALRILSIVVDRYTSITYREPPNWVTYSKAIRGISPSLNGFDFNILSIFHRYADPPAVITAFFETGETVEIHIGPNMEIYAVITDRNQHIVSSKAKALKVYLPRIDALPQITPLPQKEEILNKDYVRSSLSSSLTSLHFRNQLNLFPAYFENFQTLSKDTWPGLSIRELTGKGGNPHETLALLVQDGDFVAEVAWMGHGLQMWLQTIWFLSRTIGSSTIILDEPDVYLHADLQRKLIRILKLSAKQVIIATHSLEIMAEVDAQDVLIINRNAKESLYASSIPIVQRVIDNIGGVHNLQLTRLWHSQRCLLVEGKDVSLLKLVQNILYPESELPLDTIPNMPLGGWSGWNYAIGSKLILKNAVDDDITVYCILDSDYHTPNEIQERINQAKEKGIDLHIWKKKEIENYFIVPEAIQRIIADENKKDIHPPTIDLILEVLDQLLEKQKDNIFDAISTEFLAKDKAGGVTKANNKARSRIEEAWKTRNGRLSIVSGKKILSELSNWSQDMFGVSLSAAKLLRKLHKGEIETEVVSVIKAIEKGSNFISRNL